VVHSRELGAMIGDAFDCYDSTNDCRVREEAGKHMRLTMKRTIILLFPILGLADITSVRVTGTTAMCLT